MYKDLVGRVCKYFGIEPVEVLEYQKGYRNEIWPIVMNDNRMLNLTFYKREDGIVDRINRADFVAEFLFKRGLPTKTRADKRLVVMNSKGGSVYVGLYNYLGGATIPWEEYTMEHLKNLGQTMSDMHKLLKTVPNVKLPLVYEEYKYIVRRMEKYFDDSGVKTAMTKKLRLKIDSQKFKEYLSTLAHCQNQPNYQPIHMDFVRGNILFDGKEVCGVLDFEKVSMGHSFTDIARTLAFLIVDCKYKEYDKIIKYFLYSGYQKRGTNNEIADFATVEKLIDVFLTYDFYKFLVHNPYESLQDNEHYVRTCDILLKRNVISYK